MAACGRELARLPPTCFPSCAGADSCRGVPQPSAFQPPLHSNYRACVRAHQSALQAQRTLWCMLIHDTLSYERLRQAFANMTVAEARADQVYKR